VARRFVFADVNLRLKDCYDKRQFTVNRAAIYKPRRAGRKHGQHARRSERAVV